MDKQEEPIRVLLADDQALIRDGLKTLLELEPYLDVTAVADGRAALAAAATERPDVVLLDVRMPVMDGVTCVKHLKEQYPDLPVLMLTTYDDDYLVRDSLAAGASAYLLKDMEAEDLVAALRLLVAGGSLIPGDLARALLTEQESRPGKLAPGPRPSTSESGEKSSGSELRPGEEPLTPRQREVLGLIAAGMSNGEIAKKLFLSEGTVKNTVSEIYARLQVRDRVQAVLKARSLQLGE